MGSVTYAGKKQTTLSAPPLCPPCCQYSTLLVVVQVWEGDTLVKERGEFAITHVALCRMNFKLALDRTTCGAASNESQKSTFVGIPFGISKDFGMLGAPETETDSRMSVSYPAAKKR